MKLLVFMLVTAKLGRVYILATYSRPYGPTSCEPKTDLPTVTIRSAEGVVIPTHVTRTGHTEREREHRTQPRHIYSLRLFHSQPLRVTVVHSLQGSGTEPPQGLTFCKKERPHTGIPTVTASYNIREGLNARRDLHSAEG